MDTPTLAHGIDWSGEWLGGWWLSEKLDGCRAMWDGEKIWTRTGNRIAAPAVLTARLPAIPLDGEIWAGRGGFQTARLAVQYGRFVAGVEFVAFDAPSLAGSWGAMLSAAEILGVRCVARWRCADRNHLRDSLAGVLAIGGEGLIARDPRIECPPVGRTTGILKLKKNALRRMEAIAA